MTQHDPAANARPGRVHIYSQHPPAPNTTGAGLAICSQIQAFLDLGFDVEYIHLVFPGPTPPAYFPNLRYTPVEVDPNPLPLLKRLPYLLNWPRSLADARLYRRIDLAPHVRLRRRQDPTALHVFNYLPTAHVIPYIPLARSIWVCHEIESEYLARNFAIDRAPTGSPAPWWEKRMLGRVTALQHNVARKAGLVLCVAEAEARRIREEWGVQTAAYLPMSVAATPPREHVAPRPASPPLRILHLGDVTHFPTLSSIEFLCNQVLPLLDAATLDRLQIEVAGKLPAGDPRVDHVMALTRPFPQFTFSGFVQDLHAAYRRNHLQVVGAQQATGVRTRILESWSMGLPVLSTTIGAGGVEYLAPNRNILIADDAPTFAARIRDLVADASVLPSIAAAGRDTYLAHYSPAAVAARLREILDRHLGYDLAARAQPEAACALQD